MESLGGFFTRTLVVAKEQKVVDTGLYSYVSNVGDYMYKLT
jgi:hypothetical protein